MNTSTKNKILIIGDLHIGNNKNNPVFHKIALDYAKWIKEICIENEIDRIVQLGDVFHDRVNINLSSLDCAFEFFDLLKDYKIDILTGNHDCYFLDNSSVNSLKTFSNWPNITVHDGVSTNDGITFCGWGTKLEDIPMNNDVIFGHFDIVGFELTKGKISEHGFRGIELMQKTKRCFSGHYHRPQVRLYSGKPLVYTGSAYQLNWGDSGNACGVNIIDMDTLEVDAIPNTVSPTFEYINDHEDFKRVDGNFISVQIESMDDPLLTKIQSLRPLNIKPHLIEKHIDEINIEIEEFKVVDIPTIIGEYVECMELTPEQKKIVTEKCCNIYSKVA